MRNKANVVILGLFLTSLLFNAAVAEVVIHPAPGDLSGVEGLQESKLFDLSVNGRDTFVYHGFELNFNNYGFAKKGGHYVNFAFDQEVVVDITTQKPLVNYTIKPTLENVKQVSPTHLQVRLTKPAKFLVTAQLDEQSGDQWLIVSAERPETETIDPADPSVVYLKPGVHKKGRAWDPFVNGKKTLYIAGGAVLQATFRCVGKDGVRICGPGLISQAWRPHAKKEDPLQCEWLGDCMGMYFRDGRNLNFESYAVINCPSYQLEVANCDNVKIKNIKLLGFGEGNNDGAHLYSRNVMMEDCFLAGSDDRICVTGLYDSEDRPIKEKADQQKRITSTTVKNLSIRNVVFFGQKNGGDIMLSWNGAETCDHIRIENCQSLGKTNKGFLSSKHGGSVCIRDIEIRNVHLYHDRLFSLEVKEASCWGAGGGSIRDVTLENITIDADPKDVSLQILGHSSDSMIENMTLKNVTANGQKLTDLKQTAIKTNEFVRGIRFE